MKVLIVDDSRAMRSIVANIFKQLGHETAEAGHGLDAYEKLAATPDFDLVAVDWNMPVMNGLEFVQKVRANPAFANVAIMMVTTEIEIAQVATAMQAGANAYVMKPFSKETLLAKLEHLTPVAR
jgi:two-component system chemotaxis response regulator CheY